MRNTEEDKILLVVASKSSALTKLKILFLEIILGHFEL